MEQILYRAATRTFNSTPVLRYLFTVHASLGEFDLASKALDSYLEIITKGKARMEKSGESEAGLDTDALMLQAIAAGISMLCRFGRRQEAERACELAKLLEKWLQDHSISAAQSQARSGEPQSQELNGHAPWPSSYISTAVLAIAYQAIGTSQAHWARLTYQTSNRVELQTTAISNLRKALEYYSTDNANSAALYALALVSAETRDIDGALASIKLALSGEPQPVASGSSLHTSTTDLREQDHKVDLKCWHLLALLLSARQDFETAEASCEAALGYAFDPYKAQQDTAGNASQSIDFFEKQNIIEMKITLMALTEINDGPEAAVNRGGQLLSTYASLFSDTNVSPTKQNTKPPSAPPTVNSTAKSFRASMFGRSNNTRSSLRASTAPSSIRSRRGSAEITQGPTISVTQDGIAKPSTYAPSLHRQSSKRLQKRASKRSISRSDNSSPTRTLTVGHGSAPSVDITNNVKGGSITSRSEKYAPNSTEFYPAGEVGLAVSHDLPTIPASPQPTSESELVPFSQPLPSVAQTLNTFQGNKNPEESYYQSTKLITTRLPPFPFTSLPIHFSETEQQRQALSLLIRIWLVIAGTYRRAKMYDDAQGAVDEAFKNVKTVEALIASQNSSAHAFDDPGWGGLKSVEELWADVYHERGNLFVAQSTPHDAILQFESALAHFPDHPGATVGLSNILLDVYTRVIPLHRDRRSLQVDLSASMTSLAQQPSKPILATVSGPYPVDSNRPDSRMSEHDSAHAPGKSSHSSASNNHTSSHSRPSEELDRLAARDRAYGLLSSLTKLGTGWDDSEAWFALARAYEESGQIEKSKEVLWWVVELEEKRPIRPWSCLGQGYCL